MCYPCRCPKRSVSCHGGSVCCPKPCCRERSRSTCSHRVIFPGEFQKFSDIIPPSFLLKQPPKCEKVKKKSNSESQAAKKKKGPESGDKEHEDNLCDPEQPRTSGECVETTGVPGNPCQPTDTPWCGTNGPWENPMAIGMPPQPQWVCFECPATICYPRDPPGLPAAGLPTKRSSPFNPCTGQVYQNANRQMMVENNKETAQCPTYNQFCQGVNICFSNANPWYQFNPSNFGDGANPNEPNRNQPYGQSYQGYGNVAKAMETRKGINSGQHHQYNQHNYGEGTNLYEANRNQPYSQFCQGINMCPGPAYPYYPYDGGDGTCRPPPEDPRSLSPQGDIRSRGQRKGKETREGKVGKARKGPIAGQRHQYNQDNCVEREKQPNRGQIYTDPRRNPQQNPSSGHVSQGGKRSASQGTRNEAREAPRSNPHKGSNSRNPREESMGRRNDPHIKQSGQVAQQNPAVGKGVSSGHVSQGGKRSASQGTRNESREASRSNPHKRSNSRNPREESMGRTNDPRIKQSGQVAQQNPAVGKGVSHYGNRSGSRTRGNQSIEAPRLNNRNQYNSQDPRKKAIDPRMCLQTNSSGNQVPRSTNRSKSLELRNETRVKRQESARVPHPCKSRTMSPERAPRGDGRSKSLEKRNDPREQRSKNMPKSNLHFYQQNVGMSFGPSNQHYVAECPLPDPIYTTQLESTVGDTGSRRQRNESQRGTSTRKNGESREECKSRERGAGNQPAREPYRLRFNPNNQYCHYYVSDECFCPPSPEDLRSFRVKSHDLASNDRSQLLNRTNKSRPLDDRQMSTHPSKTSKKQPASGANKSTCKKCTQTQPCKPKPTLADILANEISSEPHVLMLSTQRDEKKKKKQKARAEPEIPEAQDQCSCDAQEEVISCESLEDSSSCSETVSDNGEDKPQEKAQKKHQENAKKKAQEESKELSNNDDAEGSGCPNNCWMRCPNPWSCCYGPYSGAWNGPCNGRFYYCGNRCNGCRQCCNYRCNPCGGYCCSQPPVSHENSGKASTKSKEKPAGGKGTHKRTQGGASDNHCIRQPSPTLSFPHPSVSTMPGYYPTVPPQFISPYSGHWQASEVVSNPMFSKQYP